MNNLINDINRVSYDLLINEPFYGHLFVGFIKKPILSQYEVTIQPSGEFILFAVEPNYWFKQNNEVKKGLLKHELLHIIYKHPIRAGNYNFKNIIYLACDLVVNQELKNSELPDNAFTLDFLKLNGFIFSENKTLKYYYDQLLNTKEKIEGDLETFKRDFASNLSNDNNYSFSEQIENLINSENDINKKADYEKIKQLNELLKLLKDRVFFPSHNSWKSFEEINEARNGILDNNIDNLINNTVNKLT
jgi:predicted metal-dependent peptidase